MRSVIGDLPTREVALQIPELEEMLTAPVSLPVFAKAAKPKGKWDSAKHRPAIQAIVDKFKNSTAMKPLKNNPDADSLWESIVTHGVDYVCNAIHAEAAEETA